jgi:hypothetical protein
MEPGRVVSFNSLASLCLCLALGSFHFFVRGIGTAESETSAALKVCRRLRLRVTNGNLNCKSRSNLSTPIILKCALGVLAIIVCLVTLQIISLSLSLVARDLFPLLTPSAVCLVYRPFIKARPAIIARARIYETNRIAHPSEWSFLIFN